LGVEKVKIYETDKERILKLRKAGLSYRDIGKRFNCTASAVLKRVRKWKFKESQDKFKKKIAAKVAQVNQFILDLEKNEDSFRDTLRALFGIEDEEKKKKPIQVKREEVEIPAFWSGGDVTDECDKICKQQDEGGLLSRHKTKIYPSTKASRKAYLERQKYYKDSS